MVGLFPSSTQPISFFGIPELSSLLDSIETAAILLDGQRIAVVNAKVTELTAYTRHEMIGKHYDEFLSCDDEVSEAIKKLSYTKPKPEFYLLTRNKQKIKTSTKIANIGDRWKLLTFEPELGATSFDEKSREELSSTLAITIRLIQTLNISNIDDAIAEILEIGNKLVGADVMAVYIGNSDKPSARRIASLGDESGLPMEIHSSSLNQLREPTHWVRGQRSITTFLQQSARMLGFSFLVTYPIRDVASLVGAIVAVGFNPTDINECMKLLEILSTLLAININKNTLVTNLLRNIRINENNNILLDSIKEITSDGIITISPTLKIKEMNKSAELILGYGNHEVQQIEVGEILIGTDRIIPAIQLSLQGVTTPNLGEINLHRRDGSQFPAEVSVVPIQNKNEVLGVFVVLRDRSETEQFRVHTHQLEQRALLGEVTAVFAHEVRNPINNISTGLQLMAEDINQEDPKQEIINRMMIDCTRLTDLMESVLTFSRSGNYKLVPIEIGTLIKRIANQWASRMNRLQINYHLNIPDQVFVEGDRRALEQVFTNLISNAIQAMEGLEGGTLAIKVAQNINGNGRSIIQIDVSDTGPGIPKENIGRIFEPFFTTKKNGTGLGLSITKQIITAHKGSINLTSFPGGTVFHVKLPAINETENSL